LRNSSSNRKSSHKRLLKMSEFSQSIRIEL